MTDADFWLCFGAVAVLSLLAALGWQAIAARNNFRNLHGRGNRRNTQ